MCVYRLRMVCISAECASYLRLFGPHKSAPVCRAPLRVGEFGVLRPCEYGVAFVCLAARVIAWRACRTVMLSSCMLRIPRVAARIVLQRALSPTSVLRGVCFALRASVSLVPPYIVFL